MSGTFTIEDGRLSINGYLYSADEIEAAVDCAWLLALAYARADAENGGGESVKWEDVNDAYQKSLEAIGTEGEEECDSEARAENNPPEADEPDDEKVSP